MDKLSFTAQVEHDAKEINLYYTHIKLDEQVYAELQSKGVKRIMVSLNGAEPMHTGMMPVGDGRYFIIMNKKVLKEHDLNIGDEVAVSVWPDTSRYGMPISEELKELLIQDPEGDALFHQLTDGKIRSLIHKVNTYKSSDKRLEKSLIILDHLKANAGKLDWKMLNEAFKMGRSL